MDETKKCQECMSDIPKKAKRCSKCGAKQKTPTNWKVVLLLIIIVPIFIGIIGSSGGSSQSVNQNTISKDKAYIISQNFIKMALKSPSTADFPLFNTAQDLGNGKYKVASYVDSQNGFGATIRTDWSVTIKHSGGNWADSSNWTLEELKMNGEKVYPKQ